MADSQHHSSSQPQDSEKSGMGSPGTAEQPASRLPAANLEALQDLLRRVESATGASKSLSRDIQCRVGGWYRRTPSEGRTRHPTFIHPNDCRDGRPVYDSLHGTDIWREPPDVTASLDAALALVERVLPGAMWQVGFDPDDGSICARLVTGAPPCQHAKANHDTPALALLAALLRALIAEAQAPGLAAGTGTTERSVQAREEQI